MGHQVLELEKTALGLKIVCQLHHYYQGNCTCGHQSKSRPGEGITSTVEGRTRNLKLTEYVLVGSVFATLIASMGVNTSCLSPKASKVRMILEEKSATQRILVD